MAYSANGANQTYLLRRPGAPPHVRDFVPQIDDLRLAEVLDPSAPMLHLYDQAVHTEGPVWEAGRGRLVFSDVTNRRVLVWYPDGRVEVLIDATPFINGNAVDGAGRLVHCEHLRRCISRSPPDDSMPEPIVTHFEGKRLNTPNDVVVAKDGAIWFTDPIFGLMMPSQGCLAAPELDHRSVYRFDPATAALHRMADFDQPNGLAFDADGAILYVSDTSRSIGGPTHEILAFDVEADGTLANRRFFCHTDNGVPDGFMVDIRGWVWTTAADGVHILDSQGVRLGFLPLPITCSNCTLGGEDGRRFFITAEQNLFAIDLATASA